MSNYTQPERIEKPQDLIQEVKQLALNTSGSSLKNKKQRSEAKTVPRSISTCSPCSSKVKLTPCRSKAQVRNQIKRKRSISQTSKNSRRIKKKEPKTSGFAVKVAFQQKKSQFATDAKLEDESDESSDSSSSKSS